jgi:hypothetical protein
MRSLRAQMFDAMFAPNCTLTGGGFGPARDITAITVNRWPHARHTPMHDDARLHLERRAILVVLRQARSGTVWYHT